MLTQTNVVLIRSTLKARVLLVGALPVPAVVVRCIAFRDAPGTVVVACIESASALDGGVSTSPVDLVGIAGTTYPLAGIDRLLV